MCKDEWSWKWEYFERCIRCCLSLMSVLPRLTLDLARMPSSVYIRYLLAPIELGGLHTFRHKQSFAKRW